MLNCYRILESRELIHLRPDRAAIFPGIERDEEGKPKVYDDTELDEGEEEAFDAKGKNLDRPPADKMIRRHKATRKGR